MKIAEASQACGLSAYTIRFYEKSGMLPEVKRGPDGHRRFTPQLIEWLTLLYWLRETGMSLKQSPLRTSDAAQRTTAPTSQAIATHPKRVAAWLYRCRGKCSTLVQARWLDSPVSGRLGRVDYTINKGERLGGCLVANPHRSPHHLLTASPRAMVPCTIRSKTY